MSRLILVAIELAIRILGTVVLTWTVEQLRQWARERLSTAEVFETVDEADRYAWEEECL